MKYIYSILYRAKQWPFCKGCKAKSSKMTYFGFSTACFSRFLELIVGQHAEKCKKPFPVQKRVPKTHDLHKKQKMKTVPLDMAPERRTKRCSPRFRPGGRFWNQVSDTCRQAGREGNVSP